MMANTLHSAHVTTSAPIACQSISYVFNLPTGTYPATVEVMHVTIRGQTIDQIARVLVDVTRADVVCWGGQVSQGFSSASVDIGPEVARKEATLSAYE